MSLAVADWLVGIFVMPFAVAHNLMGNFAKIILEKKKKLSTQNIGDPPVRGGYDAKLIASARASIARTVTSRFAVRRGEKTRTIFHSRTRLFR